MRPLLVIAIKLMLFSTSFAQQAELTVNIGGLISSKGKVFVAIFASKNGFPDNSNQAIYTNILTPVQQKTCLVLSLKPGTYAIAVFHDENNNQKLDKNWVGYPTEKFGFSNNPKIGLSAPSFEECSVVVIPQGSVINIRLK